jgi:hypothetical protein
MSFEDEIQRRIKAEQEAASKQGTTTPGSGLPTIVSDAVDMGSKAAGALTEDGRQLGLTARALGPAAMGATAGAILGAPIGGVGAIPGAAFGALAGGLAMPVADLGVTGYNYFTGSNNRLPSQALEDLMTKVGLPEPRTGVERGVQSASRAVIDAATGASAFKQIANSARYSPKAPPPAANTTMNVAETLASNPGLQATSGALGATAGQAVVENGGSRPAALGASIAASMLPGVRPNHLFKNHAPDGTNAGQLRQLLENYDVPLSPAQKLNNPIASTIESVMRYLGGSSARVAAQDDSTGRGFTSALMRFAGQNADNALPETLQRGQEAFGQRFNMLEKATQLIPDQQFGLELGQMRTNFTRGLDDGLYRLFDRDLQRLEAFVKARSQGAVMEGQNFHLIDGELGTKASKALNSPDPRIQEYGRALSELRDSLNNLMERSAVKQQSTQIGQQTLSGTDLAQAWKDARREYAIFSNIKEAMGNATGRDKLNTGFVPPSAIAQVERSSVGPEKFARSSDPFTELVRAGQAVLPDPTPNSGTAQRSFWQDILTGGKNTVTNTAALGATGAGAVFAPLSLAIPPAVSAAWYGKPITPAQLSILASHGIQNAPVQNPPEDKKRKKPNGLLAN